MTHLSSIACATTLTLACTAPAAALDVPIAGDAQFMGGGQIQAIDLGDAVGYDVPVMEGDTVAYNSDFMDEPVYLEGGDRRFGTVEMVFLTEDDRARIAVLIGDGINLSKTDMVYVLLPAGAEADGSITLGLTGEQMTSMAQDWAD